MVAGGGQNCGCSRRSELWLLEEVRIRVARGDQNYGYLFEQP
jgi:hypothetical protein